MTKQWLRPYCVATWLAVLVEFQMYSRSNQSAFDDGHHSVLRLELIPGSLATSVDHYISQVHKVTQFLSVKFIIHASQSQ